MVSLWALNAHAAIYIVGSAPFGDWDPDGGVAMTRGTDGLYRYTAVISGTVYFVFADGQDSDWTTFNNDYRYGPSDGDQEVAAQSWTLTEKAGDHGAYFMTGDGSKYVFVFDPYENRFIVNPQQELYVNTITEDWEGLGETYFNYSEKDVTSKLSWHFVNAGVFNQDNDHYAGEYGCRFGKNANSSIEMTSSIENVCGLSFYAATYGTTEAGATIQVLGRDIGVYENESVEWELIDEIALTHDLTKYQYDCSYINGQFKFQQVSGARLNIDDIAIDCLNDMAPVTPAPTINVEYTISSCIITAEGEGVVHLFVNGEEVDNPHYIDRPASDGYEVWAQAVAKASDMTWSSYYHNYYGDSRPVMISPIDAAILSGNEDLYIVGEVGGQELRADQGVKMTTDDGVTYTATVNFMGTGDNGIEDLFAITSQLADQPDDWESISPYMICNYYDIDPFSFGFNSYFDDEGVERQETDQILLHQGAGKFLLYSGTYRITVNILAGLIQVEFIIGALEETEPPVVDYEYTDEAVIITASGNGVVHLYIGDQEVSNPYSLPRLAEWYNVKVRASAQEENKAVGWYQDWFDIAPAETPEPTISFELTDEAAIITATAVDGAEVHLYVNGVEVENPVTILRQEYEEIEVEVLATAQLPNRAMSQAEGTFVIPIKEIVPENLIEWADWNILVEFYNQYAHGKLDWDMSARENANQFTELTMVNGKVMTLQLSGKELQGAFPAMLLGLDQLRSLNLSHNALGGDAAATIEDYSSRYGALAQNMQQLNISYNDFEGNLGAVATHLPVINEFNASDNRFTELSPAIAQDVTLNINDQRLAIDADLTRGLDAVIASIPPIAYYNHRSGGQSNSLSVKLTDATQDPQSSLYLSINGSSYNLMTDHPYRGINGQEITGTTTMSSGTWTNRQQLSALFSFAMGDANMTGSIDVTDLQAIVNQIFSIYFGPFNFTASDHNVDALLNVQDVVGEVNVLLAQDPAEPSSMLKRAPESDDASAQATIYWSDGTLYLNSSVPVAAMDLVVAGDGKVNWCAERLGMIVSKAQTATGEHAVIYSLGDAVIPAGVTPIATATTGSMAVNAVVLSDADARRVTVRLADAVDGLNDIRIQNVSCRLDAGRLIIDAGDVQGDLDLMICTIDGREVVNRRLSMQAGGMLTINLRDIVDGDGYYIAVLRSAGQVIATHKLTLTR